ncbi:HD domain-containing phosphohydrolase [Rhizobium sp. BK619]|uniref:HD domain-containing phosphohydrolase n=1 Tax=Rhizobium sp. BK619 TaxID=2586989 RepID=UPI00161771A7
MSERFSSDPPHRSVAAGVSSRAGCGSRRRQNGRFSWKRWRPAPRIFGQALPPEGTASYHEKWDGTGYPKGLSGDAIPIEGRIVAVSDVFEALCSDRPCNRPRRSSRLTQESLRAAAHFDPPALPLSGAQRP